MNSIHIFGHLHNDLKHTRLESFIANALVGAPVVRTLVRMTRFPSGTPYLGPTANYDEQIDPDQLLKRIVYGRPRPLLPYRARMDGPFFGRLTDALSNAHAVLVKIAANRSTASHVAVQLRKELPADLFSVAVRYDEDQGDWEVIAYNRIRREVMRRAIRFTEGGQEWITMKEAARILKVTPNRASVLVKERGLRHRRVGGRNQILIRQRDLPLLANRSGRWKKRRTV